MQRQSKDVYQGAGSNSILYCDYGLDSTCRFGRSDPELINHRYLPPPRDLTVSVQVFSRKWYACPSLLADLLAMGSQQKFVVIDPATVYPQITLDLSLLGNQRFHWFLSNFTPNTSASQACPVPGMKLHATINPGQWAFEARGEYSLGQSDAVCVAAVIGELNPEKGFTAEYLKSLLALIPMAVPVVEEETEPRITCRVWMKEVLRRIHDAHFIHCPDVYALEAEMIELGSAAELSIDEGTFSKAKLVKAKNSK